MERSKKGNLQLSKTTLSTLQGGGDKYSNFDWTQKGIKDTVPTGVEGCAGWSGAPSCYDKHEKGRNSAPAGKYAK